MSSWIRKRRGHVRSIVNATHRSVQCPFIQKWMDQHLIYTRKARDFVQSKKMYESYRSWVERYSSGDRQVLVMVTECRFFKQLSSRILQNKYVTKSKLDGTKIYRGVILKSSGRISTTKPQWNVLARAARSFLDDTNRELPLEVRTVRDRRDAGRCVFLTRDIEAWDVVCEYQGKLISVEESKRREEVYRREGKCPRMLHVIGQKHEVIDGYDVPDGVENVGGLVNHSANNVNLQLFRIGDRVVFLATKNLCRGVELLYNYGDGGEEDFFRSSQTLTEN
ncbi:uncharacterized protein [Ptychodera flava]|uniref:uncharacterized protein n=1 Tax=Ptychodera flava TaxID=63121 RepID=UPI00396A5DFE